MATQRVLVIDDSPTIHKVVANTLGRLGMKVSQVRDGQSGIDLARKSPPDVILLDFLMPEMNGYQVCKALAQHDETLDIPIILMSAKGEMMGEKLVRTMGIVDFITKPFTPDSVATVVQHALEEHPSGSQKNKPDQASLMEVGERCPEDDPAEHDLDDPRGRVAMRGNMAMVPVPEIFQLLKFQAHTGILHLACGAAHLEIYLKDGAVISARASKVDAEFLLGRFLTEVGAITPQDLEMFLQSRSGTSKLLGEQLVKLGHITQDQLTQALSRQTEELMYEAIRWGEGEFAFYVTENLPVEAREAKLSLSVDQILMEGFRRVDEWGMIEKEIRNFDRVLAPSRDSTGVIKRIKLEADEERILALVDGQRTVKDIVRASHRSSFDVCKLLYRLLSSRIIRKRSPADTSGR